MSAERPSHAVVDLQALRSNFALARELAGRREVIGVVKADGYGHGASEIAQLLVDQGCRLLAVVTVEEACELREGGLSAPVLVMGGVHRARDADLVQEYGLTAVIHDGDDLAPVVAAAERARRRLPVQVEVDTGMRRMGVPLERAPALLAQIAESPLLGLEGVYTHFACADDPDPSASLEQIARFREVLARARERGVDPGLVHADNSAALLAGKRLAEALPEAGAVRPGLMLYGALQAPGQGGGERLRPVMSLRTRVVALRDVAAGESVGYGATWRAPRDTRVATLPIGYEDGVLRSLSSRGEVWLAGARRPIVGRVSMDYVSVDVGGERVRVGDPATFFGPAPEADAAAGPGGWPGIPVEEQARAAGTLSYELLVGVGRRVPRVVVDRR